MRMIRNCIKYFRLALRGVVGSPLSVGKVAL
jgi:hypothetical protein